MSARLPAVESVDWRRLGNALGLLVIVAVVGLFVSTAVPQVVGADHSFVVRSDSMSPSIDAGAVVYVESVPAVELSEGDVITFRGSTGTDAKRVTHRIVGVVKENGERQFRTKGDANEEADSALVSPEQVVGRVAFHVPLIGYVVTFAETDLGLVLLVVIPAGVLALTEIRDLLRAPHTAAEGDEDGSDDEDGATGEQP